MRKRRFFRFGRFLVLVPVLALLLLLVSGGFSRSVHAQGGDEGFLLGLGAKFACWASGPVGYSDGPIWNHSLDEDDEFAVDPSDLGNNALLSEVIAVDDLKGYHAPTVDNLGTTLIENPRSYYSLFDSLPELVEYAFALDVLGTGADTDIEDKRVKLLMRELTGSDTYNFQGVQDHRVLLPWQGDESDPAEREKVVRAYHDRRSVGAYHLAVKSLAAEWIDPANPGGGRVVDAASLALDQAAFQAELVEGTTTTATDGGIVHYGTSEGIGQQVIYQATSDCGSEGYCDGVTNYVNNPVPIVLHHSSREQNDGQVDRNTTGPDERRVRVTEGRGEDGEPVYREMDVALDTGDVGPSSVYLRDSSGVGYGRTSQADTPSDVLHVVIELEDDHRKDFEYNPDKSGLGLSVRRLSAMGSNAWTYDRFDTAGGRDPDVNEWPARGGSGPPDEEMKHLGYRQPGLDYPSGAGFASPPAGDLARLPESGLDPAWGRWDPKHIRWPVHFEDLNWYLYELPAGSARDSLWLYWLTVDGTQRVVYSGYGSGAAPLRPDAGALTESDLAQLPSCALLDSGKYSEVNTKAPLNLDDIECEDPSGMLETSVSLGGTGSWLHLPFAVSGSVDDAHLLGPGYLRKQGVESAKDSADPRGVRKLKRFDFTIKETERMGHGAPEQLGYEAERHYGMPVDPDQRAVYVNNWAYQSIDPNMSHLLVFTFYEAD